MYFIVMPASNAYGTSHSRDFEAGHSVCALIGFNSVVVRSRTHCWLRSCYVDNLKGMLTGGLSSRILSFLALTRSHCVIICREWDHSPRQRQTVNDLLMRNDRMDNSSVKNNVPTTHTLSDVLAKHIDTPVVLKMTRKANFQSIPGMKLPHKGIAKLILRQ